MNDSANEAFAYQIEQLKANEPIKALQFGGKEILQRVLSAYKTDKGVHVDTAVATLGALAGYAALQAAKTKQPNDLMDIKTKDGAQYFMSEQANAYLFQGQYPFYGLLLGMVQHLGGNTQALDIKELLQHVASSLGDESFGVPRMPEGHSIGEMPRSIITNAWSAVEPIMRKFSTTPDQYPILLGFALQELMQMAKDAIAPELVVQIAMECAVPMSKIDLGV